MVNYAQQAYREKIADGRSRIRGFRDIDRFVFKHAKGRILELGCGEFPYFADSFKVDIARLEHIDMVHDLNYPIELNSNRFDTIIAIELIEHLWNVDGFLDECYRLLKKDGSFIVSTPNVLYWKNRINVLLGNDEWFNNGGEHLWYFSPRSFVAKLKQHRFRVVKLEPLGLTKSLMLCGGFIALAKK